MATPFIDVEDKVGIGRSLLYGLQHVLAMFAGAIAVPLIVGSAIGLSGAEQTVLLQGVLVSCGIGTLLQTGRLFFIGARYPIVMATAFVFITPMISIGQEWGIQAIFGAMIIGGIVELIVSSFIWRIKSLFPTLVTGTVVALIGLGLIPAGFNWASGGSGPLAGDPMAFGLAGIVLVIMIIANRVFSGFLRTLSILFAIICGYIIAGIMGVLDFSVVGEARWFALPEIFAFGPPQFYVGAILGLLAAQFGSMLETIGDVYATGVVTRREVKMENLRGAVAVDGVGSALASLINGFSLTSFSQNIGVIGITGVASRHVVRASGIILIVLGVFPKFSAVVSAMPEPVLGGAGLVMFGSVAAAGINQLTSVKLTQRNIFILSTAIGVGLGFGLASGESLEMLPSWLRVFLESSVIVGGIIVIVLNTLLPKEEAETHEDNA